MLAAAGLAVRAPQERTAVLCVSRAASVLITLRRVRLQQRPAPVHAAAGELSCAWLTAGSASP